MIELKHPITLAIHPGASGQQRVPRYASHASAYSANGLPVPLDPQQPADLQPVAGACHSDWGDMRYPPRWYPPQGAVGRGPTYDVAEVGVLDLHGFAQALEMAAAHLLVDVLLPGPSAQDLAGACHVIPLCSRLQRGKCDMIHDP